MGRGGNFCGARKVCSIIGRGWKDASSGCCAAGCDSGRVRSNKSILRGECFGEPIMSVTVKGEVVVGGMDSGGLAMFWAALKSRNLQ